jgi:glutathione S-transferase
MPTLTATITTSVVTLPILYTFRRCPYAIRARMALRYAGVACVMREVVLRDKPPELLAISAKATVPVLLLGDEGDAGDEILHESVDIVLWALAQNDPDGWLGVDPQTRKNMDKLVHRCEVEFKPHLDAYKYASRAVGTNAAARDAAMPFLNQLEAQLAAARRDQAGVAAPVYLYGADMKFADVCVFPFVRQFAFVDKAWFDACDYAHLHHWLDRLLNSALFLEVMHKHPQWRAGDSIVVA